MRQKSKKYKFDLIVLFLGCLVTSVSCGNSDYNSSSDSAPTMPPIEAQQEQGEFEATLVPMNTNVAGNTIGVVSFKIEGDTFSVTETTTDSPVNVQHPQFVFVGNNCPSIAADKNGDALVDVLEGIPDYGQPLIPLDGNLSTQSSGADGYPISDSEGKISYSASVSFSQMMGDLTAPPTPSDVFTKLPTGSSLNLDTRVVVIHGVSDATVLPSTVATVSGLTSRESLPIACGKIVKKATVVAPARGSTTGGGVNTGRISRPNRRVVYTTTGRSSDSTTAETRRPPPPVGDTTGNISNYGE